LAAQRAQAGEALLRRVLTIAHETYAAGQGSLEAAHQRMAEQMDSIMADVLGADCMLTLEGSGAAPIMVPLQS
jgi:hypothetical protein